MRTAVPNTCSSSFRNINNIFVRHSMHQLPNVVELTYEVIYFSLTIMYCHRRKITDDMDQGSIWLLWNPTLYIDPIIVCVDSPMRRICLFCFGGIIRGELTLEGTSRTQVSRFDWPQQYFLHTVAHPLDNLWDFHLRVSVHSVVCSFKSGLLHSPANRFVLLNRTHQFLRPLERSRLSLLRKTILRYYI